MAVTMAAAMVLAVVAPAAVASTVVPVVVAPAAVAVTPRVHSVVVDHVGRIRRSSRIVASRRTCSNLQ